MLATKLRGLVVDIRSPVPDITPALETIPMRMFETVTSSVLAIAAQALVVGVVITTF
jgi:hypothetical protein